MMKAKIVADIAVGIAGVLFFIWWLTNVPFPRPAPVGQTATDVIAMLLTIFVFGAVVVIGIAWLVNWIHKD